jgi:hypothetical protein
MNWTLADVRALEEREYVELVDVIKEQSSRL